MRDEAPLEDLSEEVELPAAEEEAAGEPDLEAAAELEALGAGAEVAAEEVTLLLAVPGAAPRMVK